MKLDEIQKDFLLKIFFKDESFAGWKGIANNLLETGRCIVAGNGCPWVGGIGNFIQVNKASDFIDCVELTFDIEDFISADNNFFRESYNLYMAQLLTEKSDIDRKLESMNKL